ncbi:hypothetical protein DERF_002804 [Dermatophagoides farinae]|uniref:Uncharacterized protein n=1 Tax=Dermatophagoides farinae TaxID=6954 RepID=A0A922L9Z4_DERFA|nr:hypothetical protein DERF_002804 [Dermatophagoides farinae]
MITNLAQLKSIQKKTYNLIFLDNNNNNNSTRKNQVYMNIWQKDRSTSQIDVYFGNIYYQDYKSFFSLTTNEATNRFS